MQKILLLGLIACSSYASEGLFFDVSGSTSSMNIVSNIPNYTYLYAGIKLNPGYTLTNPNSECKSINKYGYCIFEISNLSSKTFSISGTGNQVGATICLNANGPVSCQEYAYTPAGSSFTDYVYVVNSLGGTSGSGFISLCQADSSGVLSNCQSAGNTNPCSSAPGNCSPRSIIFDQSNQYAYITYQNSVSSASSYIVGCAVNSGTKMLGNCNYQALMDLGTKPNQIAYAKKGGNEYVYTTTTGAYNSIYRCSVSGSAVSSCTNTSPSISSVNLTGIAINAGSTNMYVANNSSGQLVNCTINNNAGDITCGSSFVVASNPEYISLDVGGTPAFIPFFSSGIGYYPIVSGQITSTGSGTAKSSSGLSNPNQSTPNSVGTYAFVSNAGTGKVLICPINTDNTFGSCQDSSDTFDSPVGIAVIPNN